MSLLGSLVKGTGIAVGKGLELGIKATGGIGGNIAEHKGNYILAEKFRKNSKLIGDKTQQYTKTGGRLLGNGADKVIEVGARTGAYLGEHIANGYGFDVNKSKKIGAAVGSGAVGLFAGEAIGGTLSSIIAINGSASTGAAISSLHGAAATNATLSALGGGTLATGGAGIAGGHAVLTAIDGVSTISASVAAIR